MMHFIDGILEPALWFLAGWSARWGVLIGVLAAILVLGHPRRAATRSLLSWVVLLAGLLIPVLPHWGPGFQSHHDQTTSTARTPIPLPDSRSQPQESRTEVAAEAAHARESASPLPEAPPAVPSDDELPAPRLAPTEPLGWHRLLLLGFSSLWAGGVALLLFRRIGGWLYLERMRRGIEVIEGAPGHLFETCRRELAMRRGVVLASHPRVASPIALGLFRPMILVPRSWTALSETAQRGCLLHELAHLARRDDWSALLLEVTRVFFFFHPLVHWLLARLEYEWELLCDEAALAGGLAPRDYARVLLEFSRQPTRLSAAGALGPFYPIRFGKRRTVKPRIKRLLETNMICWMSPLSLPRAVLLGSVFLVMALALGSVRLQALETPQTSEQPEPPAEPRPSEKNNQATVLDGAKPPSSPPERQTAFRVKPNQVLHIQAIGVLPDEPIDGAFLVEPAGQVALGPLYGRVRVAELPLEEAQQAIEKQLTHVGLKNPQVAVSLSGWVTRWPNNEDRTGSYRIKEGHVLKIKARGVPPDTPMDGEFLVQPGGTVQLGPMYGRVPVAGLTPEEAECAVVKQLKKVGFKGPAVSITLGGWEHDWHDLKKEAAKQTRHVEPDQARRKESLLYGGKTFAAWREVLRTELKPQVRAEAIQALTAFGMSGYGEEAVSAILKATHGYDVINFDSEDNKVIEAASRALNKIGAPALQALLEELRNGGPKARRFAVHTLEADLAQPQDAIPLLIAATKDEDAFVRQHAIEAALHINHRARGLVAALIGALKDENRQVRRVALTSLGSIGKPAKVAVPALIDILKDDDEGFRNAAWAALQAIKPDARTLVPVLAASLEDQNNNIRENVFQLLKSYGAEAKDAVPALIALIKKNPRHCIWPVMILEGIGPAAKDALPVLNDLLNQEGPDFKRSPDLIRAVNDAIGKINK